MSRALIIIRSTIDRERASRWIAQAAFGTRVEFKQAKRSLDQNSLMWALLTEVAMQKEHCGHKYPPQIWKCLFMHACGQEMKFLPSLDGQSVIPLDFRSSDLGKDEMTDLIEFIFAWGAQNGVAFKEEAA